MSTIFPLPSSPHCAPSTAMLVDMRLYRSVIDATSLRRNVPNHPYEGTHQDNEMIELDGSSLTLDQLVAIAHDDEKVGLTAPARARVRAARAVVDEFAHRDEPAYGINTGFGNFANVRIPVDQLDTLQVNLLRSHAAGVG